MQVKGALLHSLILHVDGVLFFIAFSSAEGFFIAASSGRLLHNFFFVQAEEALLRSFLSVWTGCSSS